MVTGHGDWSDASSRDNLEKGGSRRDGKGLYFCHAKDCMWPVAAPAMTELEGKEVGAKKELSYLSLIMQ